MSSPTCTCSTYDLAAFGCKCGAFAAEQAAKKAEREAEPEKPEERESDYGTNMVRAGDEPRQYLAGRPVYFVDDAAAVEKPELLDGVKKIQ